MRWIDFLPVIPCRVLIILVMVGSIGQLAVSQDWPRFRGLGGSGVSSTEGLPTEFGPTENLIWRANSGLGTSSPILIQGRLLFTSFHDDDRIVHCLDAQTGDTQWTKSFGKLRDEVATEPAGPATPTPVSDGHSVFALFPDVGLVCCSLDGEERWRVELPPFHSFHGMAASLVLAAGNVVVQADQLKGSYLAAYNKKDGERAWRVDRIDGIVGGFSTPTTHRSSNGDVELLASGPAETVCYDAATGNRKWWVSGLTSAPISVPLVHGDALFLCEPFYDANPFQAEDLAPYDKNKDGAVSLKEVESEPTLLRLIQHIDQAWGNRDGKVEAGELEAAFRSYVNSGGLVAVRMGGTGDVTSTNLRWSYRKAVPQVASLLVYKDILYFVNDGGLLTTVDPQTGDVIKRGRIKQGGRKYYASPVAADGKVFLVDTDGKMAVIRAAGKWEWLATNALGEPCYTTPAIGNGRLYVRTQNSLFCFGQPDDDS